MNPDDMALDERDLRNVFAAMALLAGVIVAKDAAELAYAMADAMLAAKLK